MRTGLGLLLALLIATGCSSGGSSGPGGPSGAAPAQSASSAPKRVVVAIASDPPSLRTQLSRAAGGSLAGTAELEQLVHAGLSAIDHTGKLQAQLADDVPTLENGRWRLFPDGRMETTWTIRSGAVWHDGTPVTAEDLVFTTRIGQDTSLVQFRHAAFEAVEDAAATDPRTFVMTWRQPYIDADRMFSASGTVNGLPIPRHLAEQPYLENRGGFLDLGVLGGEEFVGAGPYRVREWSRGTLLQLDAFDRYVLGRPKIDSIDVRFIPDPNTLLANILGGTVDVPIGRGVGFEHGLQLESQWRDGVVGYSTGGSIKIWAQLSYPNPAVIGDVRFRRAIYHAIDRQQLVDTLMDGRSQIAHTQITPADPEYPEVIGRAARYEFDPRRAAQILEGLGYTRGTDSMYRDVRGEPLVVEYRSSPMDILRKTKLAVADRWQSVGVGVNLVDDPPSRRGDNEYRALYPGFDMTRGNSGTESFRTFHSSEARGPHNRYIGQNVPNYVNAELDGLIERFLVTIPQAERMRVAGDVVHHLTDQVIVLDQFYDLEPQAVASRVTGAATQTARSATNTWNVHTWDMR